MTIEVTGPDGAIHEFPDDTTPDVIKADVTASASCFDKYCYRVFRQLFPE
jgi:hypothetical protein